LQVECSIIVTKERIDFVQLLARVESQDFVGISSTKERPQVGQWGSGALVLS